MLGVVYAVVTTGSFVFLGVDYVCCCCVVSVVMMRCVLLGFGLVGCII